MCIFGVPGRNWCLVGLLAFLSFFPACQKPDRVEKDVFHLNLSSGNLESMDPAFARDLYVMWMTHMVFNTLVETDENLNIIPSLAKRWEVSPDGRVYRFQIRDSIFFHDSPAFPGGIGRKMTAADVVYSFERIMDPKLASPGSWIFNDRLIDHQPFRAINDTVLEIHLREAFAPLPGILSMPYCGIVPREVVEYWGYDFRSHPCGTGPFTFILWEEGNQMILHKNPRYWERDDQGNRLPYLDAVQVGFVNSKATEFFLFLQGKLDFVNNLDASFKDLVLTKNGALKPSFADKFVLTKRTYLNTEYIGFLMDTALVPSPYSPVRFKKVRQAINYAIDRRKIARYFRNGCVLPATGGFIPPGLPGHDTTRQFGYHYDLDRALELLAEAGFPKGKGLDPLEILTPDNYADIVNFIATQLQSIGLKVQVTILQPNILREQMSQSKAVCFRAQWIADYPDAETYLVFFNSHFPAPPNYTRFHDQAFNRIYHQSMKESDHIRAGLYRQMDSLVMEQAPLVPIYYEQLLHFTSNRVEGFTSTPMNLIELKRVKISRGD